MWSLECKATWSTLCPPFLSSAYSTLFFGSESYLFSLSLLLFLPPRPSALLFLPAFAPKYLGHSILRFFCPVYFRGRTINQACSQLYRFLCLLILFGLSSFCTSLCTRPHMSYTFTITNGTAIFFCEGHLFFPTGPFLFNFFAFSRSRFTTLALRWPLKIVLS